MHETVIPLIALFPTSFLIALVHHLRERSRSNPYLEMFVILGFLPLSSRLVNLPLTQLLLWVGGMLLMTGFWRWILASRWDLASR
jgi:hypothetical protein